VVSMSRPVVHPSLFEHDLQVKVDEAIAFIREHEPPEGYLSGFSGGKDSIVTEGLMRLSGVKYQAIYNCTRI